MARLRGTELAAFLRALTILQADADLASLPLRITSCLHSLFDCDLASFDLFDESAANWSAVTVSPTIENFDRALPVLQAHAHEHPIVSHAARHNYPNAIRTSDLLGLRQYRRTRLFNEFFRPHVMKTDRQLGFVARPGATLTIGVSVNRTGRDFSNEDRTLLQYLRVHLLQAYVTAQLVAGVSAERESSALLVDGAMCQIDAAGKIHWSTSDVERLLATYFPGRSTTSQRLPDHLLSTLSLAMGLGDGNLERQVDVPRTVEWTSGHSTLFVRIVNSFAGRWQLLFTEDRPERSAGELAKRYKLTVRESEVWQWMREGKTNAEIAIILAISPRTVEKHVERLFAKLGVYNRQAALRAGYERASVRTNRFP